ncbi:hypothetical protein [Tenacibaculum salmonis]|uniref:hypothetical protein n=1 Tax=Tenacibaculum sp. P3-BQ1 TaxID=3232310 RepID=UPI0034DF826E
MKDNIIKIYLSRLSNVNSIDEIDRVLNEIVPKLKNSGISLQEIMIYFKTYGDEVIPKSQDHSNSISNSNKADIVLKKLLEKLND